MNEPKSWWEIMMDEKSRVKMRDSGVDIYRQEKLNYILQTLEQLSTCVAPPDEMRDEAIKYTKQFLNEQRAIDSCGHSSQQNN
tara:strand:+ start:1475 stop:1723 length:249 start_codon:yes stop_codon:yes gene_type:complete